MIKRTSIVLSTLLLLFFGGCGDTTKTETENGAQGPISQNALSENGLGTLSNDAADYSAILTGNIWNTVEIDLQKIDPFANYTEGEKSYPVQISFVSDRAVAYANCFKITADYEVDGNTLYFYRPEQQPDTDHASCHDYENADEAVFALFSHDYRIQTTGTKSLLLKATDLPVTLSLSRD